jgi:selenocysteine lyase/cysteine desulfurase
MTAEPSPPLATAAHFAVEPGYLDTASIGVPPVQAVEAMREALSEWAAGRARPQDYDPFVDAARAAFAELVGVSPEDVCVGSQASALVGLVAASLPDRARVLAIEGDFTSLLFPFLAQADRHVEVTLVPLTDLAHSIGPETDLVVVSAVQSATGEIADLDTIGRAAREHDARTLVDATQACGWLPIDARRFDFVVCAAYKWLLAPRGVAFMAVRPERLAEVRPNAAGWYAGADIWSSIYGGPLRLAPNARRLDVSPAWLSWVGAVPSLELLRDTGIEAIHAHDLALANRVRDGLGMPSGRSAIVAITAPGAAERLAAAGIRASTRAGAARLSFHLHNTPADADRALEALTGRG